jgi:dTDP-4-dehydrorhamnose reductase
MKVLITGANGMVARATAEYCRSIGDDVSALTRGEMNIAHLEQVRDVVSSERPDAVINCAAYTNVDGAETDKELSFNANTLGVGNLASVCEEFASRFVTISTDYVFDGTNTGFYTQRDTPNPQGVYAKTKHEGELAARKNNARSIIVRTGWIFGTDGTNFLSVVDKLLSEGKSVTAINDAFGTPTYAPDLARRLRELAQLDLAGIYHVTNSGDGTSYFGFALKAAEAGGLDANLVKPTSMDDLKRPAPRPRSSKLACLFSRRLGLPPLPLWTDALERHLKR